MSGSMCYQSKLPCMALPTESIERLDEQKAVDSLFRLAHLRIGRVICHQPLRYLCCYTAGTSTVRASGQPPPQQEVSDYVKVQSLPLIVLPRLRVPRKLGTKPASHRVKPKRCAVRERGVTTVEGESPLP